MNPSYSNETSLILRSRWLFAMRRFFTHENFMKSSHSQKWNFINFIIVITFFCDEVLHSRGLFEIFPFEWEFLNFKSALTFCYEEIIHSWRSFHWQKWQFINFITVIIFFIDEVVHSRGLFEIFPFKWEFINFKIALTFCYEIIHWRWLNEIPWDLIQTMRTHQF